MTTISDTPLFPNDNSEYSAGDTIYISNHPYHLGDVLGHGGQGIVFEIEGKPGIVAKLYHRYVISKRLIEQLKLIVQANLRSDTLAAPINIVFDSRNKDIIGYTMDLVSGVSLDSTLLVNGNNYNKREIVKLTYNIVRAYHELDSKSSHKILAGDINPNNVMVYEKTKVKIIDLDSIQIDDFPCPVGFAGFNHPDAIGRNYREFLRTDKNEKFVLAILIFLILINKHPFAQLNGKDDDYNTKNLPFRYKLDEKSIQNVPITCIYRWSTLTTELQKLFIDTFTTAQTAHPKLITFEQWETELRDYASTLESAVQENRLLDIWRLMVDPFNPEKANVCQYCGQAFTPYTGQDLCPRCRQLNLTRLHCANKYCVTPDKVYYISTAKSKSIRYCSDCLQPYISTCKRCGCKIPIIKYELHTFDGLYCDTHRPPAKGRLTKAKKMITEHVANLTCMFQNGNYSFTTIDEALKNFKSVLNNVLKDADIEEVIPTINKVKSLIRDLELYKANYRTWLNGLKETKMPQSSAEKDNELKKLRDNIGQFDTLSKQWQNQVIPFRNTLGYKYLVCSYKVKIKEIENLHFKKCSCCGREERDDGRTSTTEYYCPDCLKVYTYRCIHCNTPYRKPRYLHDKEELGKFCSFCANEVNQISDKISKTTAKNFEEMKSFESLNFKYRREHFNKFIETVSKKIESYKKTNFIILGFDRLVAQAELVRNEELYLEGPRKTLSEIEHAKLETYSYSDLKKIQDKLSHIKNIITSTKKINNHYSFTVASLAPVPKALESIENKEILINLLIEKKINYFKNCLYDFNKFKSNISFIDEYTVDWGKRESYIKTTVNTYLPVFEEFAFDNQLAQNEQDFIREELPSLTNNEQTFYKGPLGILAYHDSAHYTPSDDSAIDNAIYEIASLQEFLKKRGTRFILNECILKKAEILKSRLELMQSILNKSFFRKIDEYTLKPIETWNILDITSLTTNLVKDKNITEEFKAIVKDYCDRILSLINQYSIICNEIKTYINSLKIAFRSNYREDFLLIKIPARAKVLTESGTNVLTLNNVLKDAKEIESSLKKRYIDGLEKQAKTWKTRIYNNIILIFMNLLIIGQSSLDYYMLDTKIYEMFILVSAISGISSLYIIGSLQYLYENNYDKKTFRSDILTLVSSLIAFSCFILFEKTPWVGVLKILMLYLTAYIIGRKAKAYMIKHFKYKLDSIDAMITKQQSM